MCASGDRPAVVIQAEVLLPELEHGRVAGEDARTGNALGLRHERQEAVVYPLAVRGLMEQVPEGDGVIGACESKELVERVGTAVLEVESVQGVAKCLGCVV